MKVIFNLDAENDSDIEEKIYEQIKKKRKLKKEQKEKEEKVSELEKNQEKYEIQNIINDTFEKAKELKRQRDNERSVLKSNDAYKENIYSHTSNLISTDKINVCNEVNNTKVQVILVYGCYRKQIGNAPKSIDLLNKIIIDHIKARNNKPVTINDFKMHYYDYEKERCEIEDQYDLDGCYLLAEKAEPPYLKICLDIKRGINNESEDNKEKSNEYEDSESSDDHTIEIGYESDFAGESFELKDFDSLYHNLIREGYMYTTDKIYKECKKFCKSEKYNCHDYNTLGYPLLFNGEYGKLVVHHNIPYEKHRFCQEDGVANTLSECRSSVIEGNTKLDRKQIEIVARKLAKEDPGISPAQLMTKIKYLFPNTDLIPKKIIHNAISHWRCKIMPLMNEKAMSISVEHIKTLRKTPFGRGSSFCMVDGRPKHFLYMYSDFQMQVASEVKDDPFLHLFIDGTFKCCPRLWSQLLNVCVLHRKKNQYIPIAHILMQTETYEGYFKVINWIKDTFGLTPKFITTDFEISLMRATKEIFADSQLVPCFFHFAKCLWNNAGKCGLKKNKLLVLTKQLIFSLKGLVFRPPNKVYRRFEFIKNKFLEKGNCFKQFLEYFESTWMDGTFQIKDWNYYDKLNEFEDLALTNNGLESFHQMIRSQLRRSQPNLFYLVDLLGRVETMKKAAYDEDKIKGDPQFNRCWPASKIFRELYSKEYENISNKLICKEMNENNLNKSQSNSLNNKDILNNENEFYPDYCLSELESLKKTNIPDYHSKRSTIEKEVLILFNEFDEENRLPHTDKGIQQLCKQRRELEDEIKTKDEKNYNMTMAESLVLNDKPSISHEMELIKNECNKKGSRRYYEPLTSLNYNPNALDIFDDKDMDVKNILEGSYSIKTNFNYAE